MTAREEILGRVRQALGREPGQTPAPAPEARIRVSSIGLDARLDLFQTRLEALGGKVHRAVTLIEARDQVARLIGDSAAVASNAGLLRRAGITALPGVGSGFLEEPALREACTTASFGVTSADYGLAEMGSLVTFASSEARLISLLPPAHIAVLAKATLLTGLDELYERHPLPAEGSSSMVLITGPSRSADIEMILVRGVHGPGVVHVIVVEEDI
ncbi:MAG: LUD domain-containing protein [Acidobacteria bacterium]|nr:LUD domain-containing protein [Acidobacteriota bacterium]